jgi:hypothetical protein
MPRDQLTAYIEDMLLKLECGVITAPRALENILYAMDNYIAITAYGGE